MKALVYTDVEELTYKDVDNPEPIGNELLVEVKAVGICGSDMHAWKGHDERRPAPLILGHEVAGMSSTGQRVTVNPLVTCMQCSYCKSGRTNLCPDRQILSMSPRQGGFAQYITIPQQNIIPVADHISYEKAALAEPIAVAWHCIQIAIELSFKPITDSNILILGGGAIGLASALVAAHFQAADICIAETNAARHANLSSAGDFNVFNPVTDNLPGKTSGSRDFDIVIDAYGGTQTQKMASQHVSPGGVIINVGLAGGEIGLDVRKMTLQDIRFAGSYTYTQEDFVNTTSAMFAGKLGSLDWFEIYPLSQGASIFSQLNDGKVSTPKVILYPDG